MQKKIIIVSILGIICLVFILIIFQTIRDFKKDSQALISQKKELILLENKIKDLENFEEEYREKKEKLEKINQLFLKQDDPAEIINFLNFLRKTATDSEIVLNISPSFQKKENSLTFQLSGRGEYKNIMRFLEKLENAPYLTEIFSLFLKTIREKEDLTSQIEFNLALNIITKWTLLEV